MPSRYATSTKIRSALRPSGSSDQRIISHEQSAMPTSETVYTFSFTTDWFHTVNDVAPISTASAPPTIRCQRSGNQETSTRSVMRNHIPALTALHTAASTFTRKATVGPNSGLIANTRPSNTKNGLPGGCGSPNVYAAAMYSLVSHIAVEGARVSRYRTSTASEAIAAARYDGR